MSKQGKELSQFIHKEIIAPLREENKALKYRVSSLEEDARDSREVVKLYKSLLSDGTIYVNTHATDCDGVTASYSYKFTDIDEYFKAKRHYEEGEFEGSTSWNVVSKGNALSEDEEGTFGQGWDIQ